MRVARGAALLCPGTGSVTSRDGLLEFYARLEIKGNVYLIQVLRHGQQLTGPAVGSENYVSDVFVEMRKISVNSKREKIKVKNKRP